jgi:anti-anti-sigma factor
VAAGQWQITDLGSSNGVEVNRRSVKSAMLVHGDEIAFGPDVTAVFEQTPASVEEEAAPPADAANRSVPSDETLSIMSGRSSFDPAVTVITVTGRIDGYNYSVFRDHLVRAIDNGERLLIVDFSLCPFCDHAGLAVVLSAKTALDKRRGRLCLVGLNQMLTEGLSMLGLRNMLAIERDEAAGVRRLVTA